MANDTADNPLLADDVLPRFSAINADHVEPAIRQIIDSNLQQIDWLLQQPVRDWDTLVQPLHNLNDRLEKAWAPVSHLNAVMQTDALREAHDACLPLLSDYHTRLGQHQQLHQAYCQLRDSAGFDSLSISQKKVIDNALRDFRLSGIALAPDLQARYGEISARLSALGSQFSNHVLDATRAWTRHLPDASELAGLPESALAMTKAQAGSRGLDGYLLTLDAPCYIAVMTYAEDRALRQSMYEAYVTRASDRGPYASLYDNTPVMQEILQLRHELAGLLGYASFADLSLATKMAESPEQVSGFLWRLVEKSRPYACLELDELKGFARQQFGMSELQSWDIAWLSEKWRQVSCAVDQDRLRQYFPLAKVLEGLFSLIRQLFGVDILATPGVQTWHADAQAYAVMRGGEILARFYTDLYAREGKRGGAWMGDCRVRRVLDDGSIQLPVAFLVCNFMSPTTDMPSLLTFDDVTTLFHEFGHGLHHMLTQVEHAPVSGINGVEWDAVELPSQFLENWCWQPEVIPQISAHYQTGEPLPEELMQRLVAARHFQSGMQMLRQLEFALFDFELHWHYCNGVNVQEVLDGVRSRVAVMLPPPCNRFQHSFTHIFAGGYAAGYYSYKWAEVLSADAFAAFEEAGVLDDATGQRFLTEILERGGAEDAMTLFRRFRGRDPDIEALLRHSGLAGQRDAA